MNAAPAPEPTEQELQTVAVLYARQLQEVASLWGAEAAATIPTFAARVSAEQKGWVLVYRAEQKLGGQEAGRI